ncbi:serine/threonine-protein kinase [Microtetraspora niveoalba]|uniref:serine/threonine-protein kinase n=1 Tax=Microtetraspora niveoalba TaxID=46175 RepID=UPI0008371E45|nr:serine/threonine-protein kinase [Microtetraspora niveoalba]
MTASVALQAGDPQFIGPYRLIRRLGAGGQGIVYLGTDPSGAAVAVKILRPEIAHDDVTRERFAREVGVARRVASFCTAQFLAADLWSNPPYIVTEFVDGPSLQDEVTRHGPRGGAALHRLAVGTATALTAIHEAGLVHRDFKPGNVLLGQDGPRVIDFGIARALDATATVGGQVIGTPAYMAPEQVVGAPIGPPADVFAWGAVVAFAATGRSPFAADSAHAVLYRVINAEPEIDGVPEPLRSLVRHCLAKDPGARPPMREVLMRLLGSGDPATASTPTQTSTPVPMSPGAPETPAGRGADTEPPASRAAAEATSAGWAGRVALGGVSAVLAVLVGAASFWLWQGWGGDGEAANDGDGRSATSSPVAGRPTETAAPAPPRFSRAFQGAWKGALAQSDGRSHPMIVTIRAGARSATVRYPDLGCSGRLTLAGRAPDGRFLLRETITEGTRCSQVGAFTMKASRSALTLMYIPQGADAYSATVTLVRASPGASG